MTDDFRSTVRRLTPSLSPAAARVASYLDRNRATVLASSAAQIAAQLGTSDATVIRAVQALGFDGLPDLKQALAAGLDDRRTPAADMGRTLAEVGDDAGQAIDAVLDAHREGMEALRTEAGRTAILAAITALHPAARIGVFGIGPSAHLARYLAFQLTRSGRRSFLLDATGWSLADQLLGLRADDAVLLLAYGQPYREVQAVMAEARRLGLRVVLVTDTQDSALARQATVVLLARRGRANQVALHATTLIALEAVILGLAAADRDNALQQLADLDRLRKLVGP
ncbi:MurR/RpiR family transcriptional regulator [Methylobacterium sp. J-070]|uniref:MurR/RpiR family transcriptional regulator n=1 Tax=Methylobacterium sp. J-070 TaxID=2836650 RepID=UPI001FBB4D4A|nr:MurR/RpiR family transcriptional regulator [Methylobacterium sp. J-070]MCJ2049138.1 MurR/RpiR family transcriptional regulator [Methylobacterium sp. J-070]